MSAAVPGKVILLGEHAVVHGGWALALPFRAVEAVATARFEEGDTQVLSDQALDTGGLTAAARLIAPRDTIVDLTSTIPAGSGLGSSAATALAVVRAVASFHGRKVDEQAMVDVAERHAHGTPSGLDGATVAADGPILFKRGEGARPVALPPLHLVVADSGLPRNAGEAVAAVTAGLEANRALIDALGQAALAAVEAGDLASLGALMDEAHGRLRTLGVSHDRLDALVAAAKAAGALGAKLTGAGRGGCVVALAPDAAAAARIAAALGTRTWTQP